MELSSPLLFKIKSEAAVIFQDISAARSRLGTTGLYVFVYEHVNVSGGEAGRSSSTWLRIKSLDFPDYSNELMPLNMTALMPLYMY